MNESGIWIRIMAAGLLLSASFVLGFSPNEVPDDHGGPGSVPAYGRPSNTTTQTLIAAQAIEVKLTDPVKPEEPVRSYQLEPMLDENGFPHEYRMFLQTDVCLDRVCNILEATLVWNALGYFERIEYADDNPLTKGDHLPFTAEDYTRLARILKNRDSLLGRNPLAYFLAKPAERDDVDGITSATPQAVKNAVVEGAAYSSWALWHWANGEVQEEILRHTKELCSEEYLLFCLRSDDSRFIRFALRQLTEKPSADPQILEACLDVIKTGTEADCRLALDVLKKSPSEKTPFMLAGVIGLNAESTQPLLEYLESLEQADLQVWEALAGQLELLTDLGDLDLAMKLLSENARDSEVVRSCVEQLSDRQNPILTLRVQRFLSHGQERETTD